MAGTRNLSRAAASLHVAQPALSRQIHDLERTLGVPLFVRHPKGVDLTMAGDTLLQFAPRLLRDLGAALDRASATAAGRRGRVVLGSARAFLARGIPVVAQEELRTEHPELTLVVHDIDPPDLADHLADGAIDLALTVFDRAASGIVTTPLWREATDHALLPAGHPLDGRHAIALSELADLPVVISSRAFSAPFLDRGLATLRAAGMNSPVLVADGGLQSVHLAVAVGRGWTVVTRSRAQVPPPDTVAVRIDGLDFEIFAALEWRRDEHRPVVRTVIEKLLEVAAREPGHCVDRAGVPLPKPAKATGQMRRIAGTAPASIEFRHLRALLAVAATQTIGRAAERLGVAQPSVSRQLKELEHAVGVRILERSARGVMLTAAGAALAGECPAILLAAEQLAQEVTRARRGMEGRCVVASVPTRVTNRLLTQLIADCAASHPHVRVAIVELSAPRLLQALGRGQIDLGLVHAFLDLRDDRHLALSHLVPDTIDAVLVSAQHRLASRPSLTAGDLADEPFLFVDRPFYPLLYDRVMGELASIGLNPRVDATYRGLPSIWTLVAQGKGWCLGFQSQRGCPPRGTVAVPLAGLEMPWGIELVERKGETNPVVHAVATLLKRQTGARRGYGREGSE